MKLARIERTPENTRPALVRPGENPALDAALARLRQKEAAGPPAAVGAAVGAAAGGARRRRAASGWWLVGLSALAIAGTVIVMVLAVLGSRRQAPAEAALGTTAPRAASVTSSIAPASAPAASLAAPAQPLRTPSASPPATPAPAPLPTRTVKPVDPALNE